MFLQAIYSEMTQNSAILAVFPGFSFNNIKINPTFHCNIQR